MCGICGILGSATEQLARTSIVKGMMASLAHRGPDGEGIHTERLFSFGHQRLAIIDLAYGQQPMHSEDDRYTLVFNGEIYNYLELRQKLARQGVQFRTFSDTEVLLKLLIHEGESALPQLNGMFAFALFDNHTGQWLLARDPFGIKPLYYAQLKDEIVFASEIKALLVHPQIQAKPDWAAIQQYLTFQFCLGDRTLFHGIRKLEPGCYLKGTGGKIDRLTCYWDANYQIDEYHTEEYFRDRLRSLLEDSIRLQLRSDVPLGAYLSGGLDSSIVTMVASAYLGSPVKLFHGLFAEGAQYDESFYAQIVAEASRSELLTVTPTAQQFVEDLPKLIYALDEPVAGPGLFPQYRVSQLASQHVKVVLGGQGGDEVFGGYARYLVGYLEQALKGAIFETQEEGQHIVTLASIIPNLPLLQQYRPLMQQFWRQGLFDSMDARYFQLIARTPDIEHLLTAEAKAEFNCEAVFADFQNIFNYPNTKSYINKMTHFDFKTLLPALLQIEDRVSMAVSLESRVPLLDTRIVDLVTSMPPSMKFQGGRTKHILKQAVKTQIPEPILNRKDKMGFPVPLNEWLKTPPLQDFVGDILFSQASRERGLFNPTALDTLIKSETEFGRQVWGVLCLELWHQKFIDV
ncbi:MAG TPA: asparagine synthase (glutamine-hydrolyzing) [Cyanobacteria bacterium UBA8803]|nr:asparagine synthase (glutamine-hydrolyzing) [Cyanobacteria bacterium UBA9273]HBL61185.1 asparagine synthase (glutamine-hydrolyzing) [Cyanobacteria bacterium UBA8803]